jgi:hypothetical protein
VIAWKAPALFCLAAILFVPALLAQSTTAGSGHWEGAIQLPDNKLEIQVDLANEDGKWTGAITVPAQKLNAFPLGDITVQGTSVRFVMKGLPGEPVFRGTLSQNGQSITGDFNQGSASFPFELRRSGEAKIAAPAKSTPVAKELIGTWEGTLDAGEKTFRLALKLSNGPDGNGAGTLVSVDQGNAEFPVTTIVQSGSDLKFDVKTINGSYVGQVSQGKDQLEGKWTQHGATFPLTFKRAGTPEGKQ